MEELKRTQMLFGKENVEKLKAKKVLVFGVGGVGGYVCEALARSGVGTIGLVDNDTVSLSNINRQIIALHSTVGRYKTDVMQERIHDISSEITVENYHCFYTPETSGQFDFSKYDYIVDCIDTVSGKIELVLQAHRTFVPVICSMGAGNKVNPCAFEVADLSKTSVCPLAKVMRVELRKRGVEHVKVVYSKEEPITPAFEEENNGKKSPASCAFIPSVVGLIIASEVLKDLMN